jgi:hypothetical protein
MDKVLLTSQAATLLVCLVAIITLFLTAKNTRANAGTQKARFLLDLRNTFMDKHKAAAAKLWHATWPEDDEDAAQSAATTQTKPPADVPSTVQDVGKGQRNTPEATNHGQASESATNRDQKPVLAAHTIKLDSSVSGISEISLFMGTLTSSKDAPSTARDVSQGQKSTPKVTNFSGASGSAKNCDQQKAAAPALKLDNDLSLYMGTLELCEVMLEDGLFDIATFYDAHGYRVEQLADQRAVMDVVLPPLAGVVAAGSVPYCVGEYWPKFAKLLWRVHIERKRRGIGDLMIGGVAAQRRIPKAYRPKTCSWWFCW